jgi:hypothetical protein
MIRGAAVMLLFLALGCGGPQNTGGSTTPPNPGLGPESTREAPRGNIEGEVERREQRMKIWGQVERIRKGSHRQLPPLTATATGEKTDPVTEIHNQTRFHLTILFAGDCGHQVEVGPKTTVTTVFCAGTYNLAALVNDAAFLPLVREGQDFGNGVKYRLDFFVEKPPTLQPAKAPTR